METNIITSQWTDESITELVAKLRNDLIKDFLDERFLKEYIALNFRLKDLPNVRIEMIRKELKELLLSPVNKTHYDSLFQDIKLTDSAALTEHNEKLFYREIENILRKYLY